ncbi:MAG: 3-keto-5-aminohexanoate cleavage protein [Eubacteriales bacterium]|nr:3-keto-5-aminohexanoate cleavage protein [Eubacteriales bacterium]
MEKIVVSVAPVRAGDPVDAGKLAEDVARSAKAGASMVHLHCRKPDGSLTPDISYMVECFEKIDEKCDIVFQASTGGVSEMNIEERCRPLAYRKVGTASLNAGSTNLGEAVYHNSAAEIRYCSEEIYKAGVIPDIEVFDIGMFYNIERLRGEIPFRTPLFYNLVFGQQGGMQANIEDLIAFRSRVPADAKWGVTHYGRQDWTFLAAAIAMGASTVRIGFEDSHYLTETEDAEYNWQLVERLVELIRAMGREPATTEEARKILGTTVR